MNNESSIRATRAGWVPRLQLVLGKHGFEQIGPELLIQRARALGAKSIGVKDVNGWLGLFFDGLDARALPQLTKEISNWVALEYPVPYAAKLYVLTEELENPFSTAVDVEMLLDLASMGVAGAIAGFLWVEPQDSAWVREAMVSVRSAASATKATGIRK